VFANPLVVNASDWDDFDDKQRKQLLLAVERMTGKKVKSPSGIARAIDQSAVPVFDCWVFTVDNAVFFEHRTTKRVQVYVLQDSFMDDDGKKASVKLAADLEASSPKSLWET
jgi:hypothetical protein